jgi:hypothetical protein
MVGFSQREGALVAKKMMENRNILVTHDKIHVKEVKEITWQTSYFHKMQQLEKARKGNPSSGH